jgi:vitamin B12 transporter
VDWLVNKTSKLKISWTCLQGAQSALHGLLSEYVFNYPVNNGRVEWNWTGARSVLIQSRLGVLQRYQQTAYATWDTSIVRGTGKFRPYLRMTNLSNTGYEEITGVRMPGRSFVGGIEFSFASKN